MSFMTKKDHALALAAKGFRVFPVIADTKRPLYLDWPNLATSDPATIARWWTDATGDPEDHNIGVSCDDLFVIDIDAKGELDPTKALVGIESAIGQPLSVVATPSGGFHAYLKLPPNVTVGNTAKKLGPTVDTRSYHGYVLGPGSDIHGRFYQWVESPRGGKEPSHRNDLFLCPQDFIDEAGAPTERQAIDQGIELDTSASVIKAIDFLRTAHPSIQGNAGDHTAYKTAAMLRNLGVSEPVALDLLLDHWNPRCDPPWQPEELQAKVSNAFQYAKGASSTPGSEFDAVPHLMEKPSGLRFTPLQPFEPASLPPREWIVPGLLSRKFVTFLASAPGAGKTQFLAQLSLAVALDKEPLINRPIAEPTSVWFFNAEDDAIELKRRLGAALVYHKIGLKGGKPISLTSGVDSPLSIASYDQQKGVTINKFAKERLISEIIANQVGLLIVDPFAELHGVPENDNGAMRTVTGAFRDIAVAGNCAVLIATHTRKQPGMAPDGTAGNQDALRGAGSQTGVARAVYTLVGMTAKEGKTLKVPEAERSKYQRLDIAKGNIVHNARGTRPDWLKWESVALGNGDNIGVLVAADLTESRITAEFVEREEQLAEVLKSMPEALTGVSWPKIVLEKFMRHTGLGESSARRWFTALQPKTKTSLGLISKIEKTGAAGSLLAFTPSDVEDFMD
jgi:AAA domain/Bifunctional DNA primase/polymerase, N-terminal